MLNDDENDGNFNSRISPDLDDTANNTSQIEPALCNPIETGIEITENFLRNKDDVVCERLLMENLMSVSEEEKSTKRNKVEADKENGAKAIKSSWRVMFHEKEITSISSLHFNSKHNDADNESQSENINVSNDASTMNLMFGSEELKTQEENETEDKNKSELNNPDEDKICEANALGKTDGMDGDGQEKGEIEIEKGKKIEEDRVDEGNNQAGSSSQKKKVLKKAEKTGMIFMCNRRTKQDCFDYKVFGLPANMKNVVRKISKGTRLFLFDIDLRVMYGIYRAAARGDYNIEPNAFNSAFPSQVRFTVVEDCTPLPEEDFRMAIKDNYYNKNMFSCQLTSEQVKKLCKLFVAASEDPNLSLKNYVIANISKSNKYLSSPNELGAEENIGKVKQENIIDEEISEENVIVREKGKAAIGEENEKTAIEEEKGNEDDLIAEDKINEIICLEADICNEEIACEEKEESTSEGVMGMIFLCNSKTKQDCLRYKVLGLPANMSWIVKKVKKEMKLFMFDVDLRVMYGIYKAAEPGGYNIEPKAFNSAFPSQVRFTVVKDCFPLMEEKFRVAILDNYYTRNKFNCQLSSEQVNKLSGLFLAASRGPDLSMKYNPANTSHSNATMSIPVDINIGGNCLNQENPILEREAEEVGANSEEKVGIKRKRGTERKLDQGAGKTGMIFMCNSKTKQDCLQYKVLGLPTNMRETVQKIKKGTRLFMFDVDHRVMYGIYKAAGPGGYNIEPKAFNSGFPSQVRFTVLKDCLPLEEEHFKPAIKDNYYTKWKFTGELTSEQVKNLCMIFSSVSRSRDRIRLPNLDLQITYEGDSYIQRVVVPMAQFPPLAYNNPTNVSHGKTNVYRGGPLLRPHGQRRVRTRQLRNRDVVVRSRERNKTLYLKNIEMKSRYLEEECKKLRMLLQCSNAENQALRFSLQNETDIC